MLKAIWARSVNGIIGVNGRLPWGYIKEDMNHFRRLTEGHTVVMGRKTFTSLGKKPLPNRRNVMLTRNHAFQRTIFYEDGDREPTTMLVYTRPLDVITNHISEIRSDHQHLWIIGGKEIFDIFLPFVEEVYETVINATFTGQQCTYAPQLDGAWHHEVINEIAWRDTLITFWKRVRSTSPSDRRELST